MSNPNQKAARRVHQAHCRLGTTNPSCCCCGNRNPHCLELHHLPGQHFGDQLVIVCRNCHRELSDAQKDHPEPLTPQPTILERIGHFLLGLADLLKLVAERLKEFGLDLIELARAELARAQGGTP